MNIDKLKQVVFTFEGSKRTAYVPMKNGKALDSSGVTIGKGFDLGQQSVERMLSMGFPPDLVQKLAPFVKLKGRAAVDALDAAKKAGTLPVLTEAEETKLNDLVVRRYANEFARDFEKYVGYGADNLSENQQLALASMYFQYGVGGKDKTGMFVLSEKDGGGITNLTNQLQRGEMDKAAGNIATWNDTYRTRNNSTALLFQGAARADQMEEAQRYVQNPAVRKTLAQGELPEELTAPFVTAQPEGIIGTPFERKAPLDRQEPTIAPSDLQDWQEPGAFELRPATQPQYATMEELLKAKGEPEYATMEELMRDRGLMNPLLPNKEWIVG